MSKDRSERRAWVALAAIVGCAVALSHLLDVDVGSALAAVLGVALSTLALPRAYGLWRGDESLDQLYAPPIFTTERSVAAWRRAVPTLCLAGASMFAAFVVLLLGADRTDGALLVVFVVLVAATSGALLCALAVFTTGRPRLLLPATVRRGGAPQP